jgi:hypothetical protein
MTSEGARRKREGTERVGGRPQDAPWRAVAWSRLLDLARTGRPFTSEDVTRSVGQPSHPNAVGALLSNAARSGVIRRVGMVQAGRANQHAALIGEWEGTRTTPAAWPPPLQSPRPRPPMPRRHDGHRMGLGGWCLDCQERVG